MRMNIYCLWNKKDCLVPHHQSLKSVKKISVFSSSLHRYIISTMDQLIIPISNHHRDISEYSTQLSSKFSY